LHCTPHFALFDACRHLSPFQKGEKKALKYSFNNGVSLCTAAFEVQAAWVFIDHKKFCPCRKQAFCLLSCLLWLVYTIVFIQQILAKFGYRSERKVEELKNSAIFCGNLLKPSIEIQLFHNFFSLEI
jgi:hypothetical protein